MKYILITIKITLGLSCTAQFIRTDSIHNFVFYRGYFESGGSGYEEVFSNENDESAHLQTYLWLNCHNFNEMVVRTVYDHVTIVEERRYVLSIHNGFLHWRRDGVFRYYDYTGKLDLEEHWKDGVFISAVNYD